MNAATVSVAKDEAERLISERAFTEIPDEDWPQDRSPRTLIHTFAGGGGILLGADWDLDEALAFVGRAEKIEWVDHPVRHDLGVLADGRVIFFDVKREDKS